MKKIETRTDVLEWAHSVVKANGEKFTALSKGDQFAIAKFIVDSDEAEPMAEEEQPKDEPPKGNWEKDEPIKGTTEAATTSAPKPAPSPIPSYEGVPTQKAVMTRSYAYHRAGFDVQQVFDKFLEWCKEHPKSREVMDFSTGRKSSDAAFAYWLAELITVDVPNQ